MISSHIFIHCAYLNHAPAALARSSVRGEYNDLRSLIEGGEGRGGVERVEEEYPPYAGTGEVAAVGPVHFLEDSIELLDGVRHVARVIEGGCWRT